MLIAGIIDTNSKASNAMLGNSKGFNIFFFIWSVFQLIYGFNAILTTNKVRYTINLTKNIDKSSK